MDKEYLAEWLSIWTEHNFNYWIEQEESFVIMNYELLMDEHGRN